MFNFFLISTGILANAYVLSVRENFHEMAAGVAIVGALVSLVFAALDQRNRQLVHLGEEVLKDLERNNLFKVTQLDAGQRSSQRGLLLGEDVDGEPGFYLKHWFLIEALQAVAFAGFVSGVAFAFIL